MENLLQFMQLTYTKATLALPDNEIKKEVLSDMRAIYTRVDTLLADRHNLVEICDAYMEQIERLKKRIKNLEASQ